MTEEVTVSFKLNGRDRTTQVDPNMNLMDMVRGLGCKGVKEGCVEGICGSCIVNLNGRIVNSCIVYAVQADGGEVETIESIGTLDNPHPIQKAMVEEAGIQCGFCIPGMIMAMKALLEKYPNPTDEQMRIHMDGNLCRCTGYEKIEDALRKVAAQNEDRQEVAGGAQ